MNNRAQRRHPEQDGRMLCTASGLGKLTPFRQRYALAACLARFTIIWSAPHLAGTRPEYRRVHCGRPMPLSLSIAQTYSLQNRGGLTRYGLSQLCALSRFEPTDTGASFGSNTRRTEEEPRTELQNGYLDRHGQTGRPLKEIAGAATDQFRLRGRPTPVQRA